MCDFTNGKAESFMTTTKPTPEGAQVAANNVTLS